MAREHDLQSPTFSPLYRQIKDLMVRSLEAGEWHPGDSIPSEAELAARFSVSQGTVRKAIDEVVGSTDRLGQAFGRVEESIAGTGQLVDEVRLAMTEEGEGAPQLLEQLEAR